LLQNVKGEISNRLVNSETVWLNWKV
jgi:hypothetical protein